MGKTLQELQKEVEKLRREKAAKEQSLKEMKKIGEKRKELEAELKDLRNPKSKTFRRNIKRGLIATGGGLIKGGRGLGRFLRRVHDAVEFEEERQRRPSKKQSKKSTKKQSRRPTRKTRKR